MIEYTYTVVEADESGVLLKYESPGRSAIYRGVMTPTEFESLDNIAKQYAPVADWMLEGVKRVVPQIGSTATVSPEPVAVDTRTPLEIAKANKHAELANWRYYQEVKGISVGGVKIQTDRESQATLSSAVVSLREGLIQALDWKTTGGGFVQLGLAELLPIAKAVAVHVQACFTAEATIGQAIDAAASEAEVDAVTFPNEILSGSV